MFVKISVRHVIPFLLLLAAGATLAEPSVGGPDQGRSGANAVVFNDAGFRPDALNPRPTLHLAGWRPASAATGRATLTDAELVPYRVATITPHLAQYAAAAPALLLPKASASDAAAPDDASLDIKTLLCVGLGLLALSASQRQQEKFTA